ncbi:hypothetical protein AB0H43_14060 [Hamadaea sp. NPDC050747]|uniref:hypothetical protein n=1 Tax=Hamadaea sp. NPDC050747 TaxID=3155789 RepID=UPI0033F7573D
MTRPATNFATVLASRLARLAAERDIALARLIAAACDHGIATLVQVGSLGRGQGDSWSDLDLIAVPIDSYTVDDICAAAFGDQIVATITVPRNAPTGGDYQAVCLKTTDGIVWIDLYIWPRHTACVPEDGKVVFDHIGLASSPQPFADLLTTHTDPTRPKHPDSGATTLLRVCVAAKYLARGDHARARAKLPQAAGLPIRLIPARLHALLGAVTEPDLAPAVMAAGKLVDLAASCGSTPAADARCHA